MKIGIKNTLEEIPEKVWLRIDKIKTLSNSSKGFKTLLLHSLNSNLNLNLNLNLNSNPKEAVAEAPASDFFLKIKKYFVNEFEKKFKKTPSVNFGKDKKVVDKSKKLFKKNEWKKLIVDYLGSNKAVDSGYSLAICFSTHTINTWKAGGLDKAVSGNFNN